MRNMTNTCNVNTIRKMCCANMIDRHYLRLDKTRGIQISKNTQWHISILQMAKSFIQKLDLYDIATVDNNNVGFSSIPLISFDSDAPSHALFQKLCQSIFLLISRKRFHDKRRLYAIYIKLLVLRLVIYSGENEN